MAHQPAESVSALVNHVDLRVYGNNQEAQDGGSWCVIQCLILLRCPQVNTIRLHSLASKS